MPVFLHELVDVAPGRGEDYADSMAEHHGTSPARRGKKNTMLGLFTAVPVQGRAPRNVNLWRTGSRSDVAAQLARQFEPAQQDAGLKKWWLGNLDLRTGGFDRFVESSPFSPDVGDLRERGVTATLFLHEIVTTLPGDGDAYLDDYGRSGVPAIESTGATLVGAFRSLHANDEVITLVGFPDAATFARYLAESRKRGTSLGDWRVREMQSLSSRDSLVLRPRYFLSSPWHD